MSKDKSEKKDKDKSEKALAAEKEQFVKSQVNMQSRRRMLVTVYYLTSNQFNAILPFTAAEHFKVHDLR